MLIKTFDKLNNGHTNAINALLLISNNVLVSASTDKSIKLSSTSATSNVKIWSLKDDDSNKFRFEFE